MNVTFETPLPQNQKPINITELFGSDKKDKVSGNKKILEQSYIKQE